MTYDFATAICINVTFVSLPNFSVPKREGLFRNEFLRILHAKRTIIRYSDHATAVTSRPNRIFNGLLLSLHSTPICLGEKFLRIMKNSGLTLSLTVVTLLAANSQALNRGRNNSTGKGDRKGKLCEYSKPYSSTTCSKRASLIRILSSTS